MQCNYDTTHPSVRVGVLSTITNDNRTVDLANGGGRQGGYLPFVPRWPLSAAHTGADNGSQ